MRATIVSTVLLLWLAACGPQPAPPAIATDDAFYAWDFEMSSLAGETYRLSDQRGQWVILNFWATWCVPCVEEMPELQAIAEAHADELLVLGINISEDASDVRAFARDHNIQFPLLIDPPPSVAQDYQVISLPQTVIVDPSGELVWRQFGPIDLDSFEIVFADLRQQY